MLWGWGFSSIDQGSLGGDLNLSCRGLLGFGLCCSRGGMLLGDVILRLWLLCGELAFDDGRVRDTFLFLSDCGLEHGLLTQEPLPRWWDWSLDGSWRLEGLELRVVFGSEVALDIKSQSTDAHSMTRSCGDLCQIFGDEEWSCEGSGWADGRVWKARGKVGGTC